MSKKQRVSPLANFTINTAIETGDLPNAQVVAKTVEEVNDAFSGNTRKPGTLKPDDKLPPKTAPQSENPKTVKTNEIGKTVAHKTPKPAKPTNEQRIVETKYGRPPKERAVGRVKFTTMLKPEIVRNTKKYAIDTGITVADLLENLLSGFLEKNNAKK
jgi:hypothetical protein